MVIIYFMAEINAKKGEMFPWLLGGIPFGSSHYEVMYILR